MAKVRPALAGLRTTGRTGIRQSRRTRPPPMPCYRGRLTGRRHVFTRFYRSGRAHCHCNRIDASRGRVCSGNQSAVDNGAALGHGATDPGFRARERSPHSHRVRYGEHHGQPRPGWRTGRSCDAHARVARRAREARPHGGGQQRDDRAFGRRDRRSRRHASTRHRHARGAKARAARRQVDRVHEQRPERHVFCGADRAAGHRGRSQSQGKNSRRRLDRRARREARSRDGRPANA